MVNLYFTVGKASICFSKVSVPVFISKTYSHVCFSEKAGVGEGVLIRTCPETVLRFLLVPTHMC